MDEIRFFNACEPYGCLSNYAPAGFELDGVWWPSSEHYYHVQKFVHASQSNEHSDDLYKKRKEVYQAVTPSNARTIAHDSKLLVRADWEQVKDDIMRKAVLRKFESNPALLSVLLATGDAELFEASMSDSHFGTGADGKGMNMLGKILMEVRTALRP